MMSCLKLVAGSRLAGLCPLRRTRCAVVNPVLCWLSVLGGLGVDSDAASSSADSSAVVLAEGITGTEARALARKALIDSVSARLSMKA